MTASTLSNVDLWVWRHPRATGAAGRCIGRTDLAIDRRKAKRLASRIRRAARRHGLPREIWTSPLQRASEVGQVLRGWGWKHRVDARLSELDFGGWDGLAWPEIDRGEVARWEADFVHHAPGGGESQASLRSRLETFLAETAAPGASPRPLLVVSHAGWISALLTDGECRDAARWPAPVRHMDLRRVRSDASGRLRLLVRSL
jgi:alpha-ribazole phosphatase